MKDGTKWRRRLVRWAMALACLATAYALRAQLLTGIGRWLDVGEPPAKVDYAFILPGEVNVRPFVAAAWYRAGLASQVLMPIEKTPPAVEEGVRPPQHEIARRILTLRGVPEKDIKFFDAETTSTFEDAQSLARLFKEHPGSTVAVITSDFHSRRTRWAIRHALPEHVEQIRIIAAPLDGVRADNWWRTELGMMEYPAEYLKLGYYQLRYGWGVVWVGGMAVLVALAWWGWRRRGRAEI
jgi:uncharacterized SAM-binding protein YcdF (DUF218 family)